MSKSIRNKPLGDAVCSLLTIDNTMHYKASVKAKRVAEKIRPNSLCKFLRWPSWIWPNRSSILSAVPKNLLRNQTQSRLADLFQRYRRLKSPRC